MRYFVIPFLSLCEDININLYMRLKIKKLNLILLLTLFSVYGNTQVTIGSNQPPNLGALLDLKQETTTTKGLGLPRVYLSGLTNITDDISGVNNSNKADHTGLVVYNTNDCIGNSGKGLYAWDGEIWILIGPSRTDQTAFNPSTGILSDFEGNTYTTSMYGAKRWMTQNLRSVFKADGIPIDEANGIKINPGLYSGTSDIVLTKCLPSGSPIVYKTIKNSITTTVTESRNDFITKFGALYNWVQAKSACPRGWHLPTIQEFTDLANNLPNGSGLSDAGVHMKIDQITFVSADNSNSGNGYLWNGHPIGNSSNSGFNALPSGYISSDGTSAYNFSYHTYWWVSDLESDAGTGNNTDALTFGTNPGLYFSVRCVQD